MTALRIDRDKDDFVTLWLDINPARPRGGVVVLDAWLIDRIRISMEVILAGEAPRGFILASASERVFVAGADLAEIDSLDDGHLQAYLRAGSHAFGLIRRLPCASVAIIHRAALGGGLEVAMHCDALLGVMPATGERAWRIGLPEAGLGICPGWGGTQFLPARIDPATAIRATAAGETWEVTGAPQGLLEITAASRDRAEVLAREWLEAQIAFARRPLRAIDHTNAGVIGAALSRLRPSLPATEAAQAVAACVEAGVQNGFDAALEREQSHLIRLRHSPVAREKLTAFLKR